MRGRGRLESVFGGLFLVLAAATIFVACERKIGVLVPSDTVTVRDTVATPPCWPPGHCKDQEARARAAAFKARVVARMAARIAADLRGRTLRVLADVPHGYRGQAFVLRYEGPVDTTIGQVVVDPNVTFDPGVDGEVKSRLCDLVASVYYEVVGDSLALMHSYDYAGWFALVAPNGRIVDRVWIFEDVCSGARLRGATADSAGTYGEAIDCILESTGEAFTIPRNRTTSGKVGRWNYVASIQERGPGLARGIGLRMSWGGSRVDVALSELLRGAPTKNRGD